MDNSEKSAYWIDCAEYDMETARSMLETRRFLYVGFMCHQTIEKALKAVLAMRQADSEIPHIHNLARLASLSLVSGEMNEEQLSLIDTLNPMNIEARYPLYKERLLKSLTVERCQWMICKTEELFLWIKDVLTKLQGNMQKQSEAQ